MLYYQPMCGQHLTIPRLRRTTVPRQQVEVRFAGPAEKRLGKTRYKMIGDDRADIWFADTTVKLTPNTPAPVPIAKAIRISCAANEAQSFQLVIRPKRDLAFEGVAVSDLVDGQDVLEVLYSTNRAILRARGGDGPTLIECKTYHFRGHSESHPADDGRPQDELSYWRSRDPLAIYRGYLLSHGFGEKDLQKVEEQIGKEIHEAVAYAEKSPEPKVGDVKKYVYAGEATSG